MPSPFPGMDPYLEGYLWPDVHHALAEAIRRELNRLIAPRYVARIAVRFVAEDLDDEETIGVVIPDVELVHRPLAEPVLLREAPAPIMNAPLVLPLPVTERVRLASVEIRDTASRYLVTSIEILSPVNKRGTGWDEYQRKRQTVLRSHAHLLELDWLRQGRRPITEKRLPAAAYFVFLTRSPLRQVEVWPIQLQDTLPVVPVPLLDPDPDVPLDLGSVLRAVYEEARYDLDVDYTRPAEPPLSREEMSWASQRIASRT